MASTYSPLKIELITTGEQSGTWGTTTNVNLGTALEEAIVGSADVTFASANVTLTLTDTNGTQAARNLRLRLTGTTGGARNLIVPAIEKFYIVQNDTADTITIKNATGTGVAIPTTMSALVYNNGTNIASASVYSTSIVTPLLAATDASFVNALSVTSGGTGVTTATDYYVVPYQRMGTPRIKLCTTLADAIAGTNFVDITASGVGTIVKTGEPRYHGGGVLKLDTNRDENLKDTLTAMAGKVIKSGAKWYLYGLEYQTPTLSYDEGDLISGITVQTKTSKKDRFNQVQGVFISQINRGQSFRLSRCFFKHVPNRRWRCIAQKDGYAVCAKAATCPKDC